MAHSGSSSNVISLRYPVSGVSAVYLDHENFPSGGVYGFRAGFNYRAA